MMYDLLSLSTMDGCLLRYYTGCILILNSLSIADVLFFVIIEMHPLAKYPGLVKGQAFFVLLNAFELLIIGQKPIFME